MGSFPNAQAALTAFIISWAVAALSTTISRTKLFEPFRRRAQAWSPWLDKLVSCPYCRSYWLAAALVLVYRQPIVQRVTLVDYLVTIFAIVGVAALWIRAIITVLMAMDEN